MASVLLIFFGILLLLFPIESQVFFTEQQKNQIINIHKQRLANEALKIFENQVRAKAQNDIFNQMINYKGLYENLYVNSINSSVLNCNEYLSSLIGFDYKRHDNRHHLVCFSNSTFVVQTFDIVDGHIQFEWSSSDINHVKGVLKQAKLYREYDTDRLYLAVLIDRGVFTIRLYEIVNKKVVDKEVLHEFQLFERVVSIDVVHYDNNKQRVVALIKTNKLEYKKPVELTDMVVKVKVKDALILQTFRLQSQGFIVFSNRSHWSVYRYQDDDSELVNEFMLSHAIYDIELFNNGHRYYAGVATENVQYIYQWKDRQRFTGVARIYLKRVYKMNALTISYAREDNIIYFDQRGVDSLLLYAYDITNSVFVNLQTFSKKALQLPDVDFDRKHSNHFFERNIIYELKLYDSKIYVFSYVTTIAHNVDKGKRSQISRLQQYDKTIYERKINNIKQNVLKLNKQETISKKAVNLTFNFDVEFRAKVIVKRFESLDQNRPEKLIVNHQTYDNRDMLVPVEHLRQHLQQVTQWMHNIKKFLKEEVVYKSKNAIITGYKEFVGHFSGKKIHCLRSYIDLYQSRHVNRILKSLYRSSNNVLITGRKIFSYPVFVERFLQVEQINKLDPSSFMFANLAQEIYANLLYKDVKVDNLYAVNQQLAPNISLSNAVFINQNGDKPITIRHKLLFDHLNTDNLQVNQINNVPISTLHGKIFLRNIPHLQQFNVSTRIPRIRTRNNFNANHINGFSSFEVFGNLLRKRSLGMVKRNVQFNGDVHVRYVNLVGQINNVRIPEDLLDRYSDQVVRGQKKFSSASFKLLNVQHLNNLRLPDDVVTLTGDDIIHDPIAMDLLNLNGNLRVGGLIDGINLTHLDQRFIASFQHNYKNLTFYKPVNVSSIKLYGPINQMYLDQILQNAIFKHDRNINIPSRKTITGVFKCNSLQVQFVNDHILEQYLTTFQPNKHSINVTLANIMHFNQIDLANTIDGVRIQQLLHDVVTLDSYQTIYGVKNFTGGIRVVDRLIVDGHINQVSPQSYLRYSVPQNITGNQRFTTVHSKYLWSDGEVVVSSFVNRRNFTEMASTIIDMNKSYQFNTFLHCINCSSSYIQTDFINKRNFTHFQNNYLSKSIPQFITSSKSFHATQRFENIQTIHGIAGINIGYINQNAITLHGYNIIRHPVIVYGELRILNGSLVTKMFDNVDIVDLSQRIVYNNNNGPPITIQGNIHFTKGVTFRNNIDVTNVNGYKPEEFFFSKRENYLIKSNLQINAKMISTGNVTVRGLINNLNLTQFDETRLKVNDQGELVGNVNFIHNITAKEFFVTGYVDGVHIGRDTVLMKNSEQFVKQMTINGAQVFDGNLNVLSRINEYPTKILQSIVLVNSVEDQIINATKTFVRFEANELHQMRGNVHFNIINNVKLDDYMANAVVSTEDRNIRIKSRFLDNITITDPNLKVFGLVNGINLTRDVVRLDLINQTITGIKEFDTIVFNQNVDVRGHLNKIDIRKVSQDILLTYGNQHILNPIIFRAPIYLSSNSTVGHINRIRPEDLITLDGKQQINGNIRFNNIITNQIYVDKYVNGFNLSEVAQYAFFKDTDQVQNLSGTLYIDKAVFNKDVQVKYHLNNVDLNVIINSAHQQMNPKFDINKVQQLTDRYSNVLYDHITQYEFANFEIEYFFKSNLTGQRQMTNYAMDLLKFRSKFPVSTEGSVVGQLESTWLKYANDRLNSHFQLFWITNKLFVSDVLYKADKVNLLEIFYFVDSVRLVRIHQQNLPSNVKPLVFSMDDQIYIFYATHQYSAMDSCPAPIQYIAELQSLQVDYSDLSTSIQVVQQFSQQNIHHLGHYADDSGLHYLVLYHQNLRRNEITIYSRTMVGCQFELMQTIPVTDVVQLVLFKFGTINLMEQYMIALGTQELNIWLQQGLSGFTKHWSIKVQNIPQTANSTRLFPFVTPDQTRMIIHAPTCPVDMFEARLNGLFSTLRILYDDYL